MRTSNPFFFPALVSIALGAAAQDVEPTHERAVRAIVNELVRELPWLAPNAEALAIVPEAASDPRVVESFTAALIRAGFTVRAGESGSGVPVRVSVRPAGQLGEISVTAGTFTATRKYGNATWVDRPAARDKMLVVGGAAPTLAGAIDSARHVLRSKLHAAYPALDVSGENAAIERAVLREPAARFIAVRNEGGRQLFEAYVLAHPGFDRLEREERSIKRRARLVPWIKAGAVGLSGLVLWALYKRADFRTRGWRTTRLRFLFGTLFVAISASLLWNLPQ
jgi:hypothetical protein